MAREELNVRAFTADSVASALANPDYELQQALASALKDALQNSEIKQAFKAMFTEEELASLRGGDISHLANALRQELAADPSFKAGLQEGLDTWMREVSISVPTDEKGVDALITQWQIPAEPQASA